MTIAAAPAVGHGRRVAAATRSSAAATFTLGPVDLQIDWADRVAITGAERVRQDDAAGRAARPDAAGRRRSGARSGVVVGEIDQARGLFLGRGAAGAGVRRRGAGD